MGRRSTSVNINIEKLAAIISSLVLDVAEVEFSSFGKASLSVAVMKQLKRKVEKKTRLRLKTIWESNENNIRNRVEELLKPKISDVSREILKTETAPGDTSSQTVSGVKHDDVRSPSLDPAIIDITETPKLGKDFVVYDSEDDQEAEQDEAYVLPDYDQSAEGELSLNSDDSLTQKVSDVEHDSSPEDSFIVIDSEGSSNESVSGYIEPPKPPAMQKKFSEALGNIQIPSANIQGEDGNIDNDKVRLEISGAMLNVLGYCCPLNFYGGIRRNSESLVTYAKCRYVSHVQNFRFDVINLVKPIVTIYFASTKCEEILHDGPEIYCTLRGKARTEVKAELRNIAPRTLQSETARGIDSEIARDGHKVKITPLATSTPNKNPSDHEQSLLNVSDSSTHANAMVNGLFHDVNYYFDVIKPLFTIGRYSSMVCSSITGFDEYFLFSKEFQTLNGSRWLDGDVIDCVCIAKLANWQSVVFVPTKYTSHLLGNCWKSPKEDTWRMYNITGQLSGKILMPYLYQNHWCLLVVDTDERTLMQVDPTFKKGPDRQRAFNAFKQYIAQCSVRKPNALCGIKWGEKDCKTARPMQSVSDGVNCGLYVLHYMDCIGSNRKFDLQFDPKSYRREVAETLLTLSRDMKETCQYCFSTRETGMVMCSTCRRWAHQLCIERMLGIRKTMEDWDKPTTKYRCPLCTQCTRSWMRYRKG